MQVATDELQRSFRLHRRLGRGGFGEVWLATMSHGGGGIGVPVALKVLREDLTHEDEAVRRLRDEARLLSRLDHPNLLKVFDLTHLHGRACLVSEYVDGQDLAQCLQGDDPLPLRALLQVLADVTAGLEAAWSARVPGHAEPARVVHRDVKPSNIRIGRDGVVKLLDFGIARTDELTREAHTRSDVMIGSPRYMAPERFTSVSPEPASDLYSLGVILWEGVSRRRMVDGPITVQASFAIDRGRHHRFVQQRLSGLDEAVPAPIVGLITDLLRFHPAERPTHEAMIARCWELAALLEEQETLPSWIRRREWPKAAAEDAEDRVRSPFGPVTSTTFHGVRYRAARRAAGGRRWGWPVAAVAAIGLAVAAGVLWTPKPQPVPVPEPEPMPVLTPTPTPTSKPDPAPQPVPDLTPTPTPVPTAQSVPDPTPTPAPTPTPTPQPAPATVATAARPAQAAPGGCVPNERMGCVRAGRDAVVLRRGDTVHRVAPGRTIALAVGRWTYRGDWGSRPLKSVDVAPDATLVIKCDSDLWSCSVDAPP